MQVIEQEASNWIGQKVVAKYHYPIKSRHGTVETQNRFRVYTVEGTEGDGLCVTSGTVAGWIPVSQVLLLDEAIDFYTQEIAADPGKSAAWTERGIIFDIKKESEKAIADFDEAIRLDPTNAVAYGNRSIIVAGRKEYEKAFADLNQAILLDPTNALSYTRRGRLRGEKEEHDNAIADFNEAIRLDPKNAHVYTCR